MKYRCASCDSTADCRKAFGRFWNVKSGGVVGCNHKFKYLKLEKVDRKPAELPSPGKTKQGGLL